MTDPWVRNEPEPDPASLRRLAAGVFVGVVVILGSSIVLSFQVPAFSQIHSLDWFRVSCAAALGRILGAALWPKRRRGWHHGPDVRWLLTTSRDVVMLIAVGIAVSVLFALLG